MIYAFPYVTCFFILVFCSIPICHNLEYKRLNAINVFPYFLATFTLVFFLGGRAFIYSDVFPYYDFYSKLPSLYENEVFKTLVQVHWEKGFVLFMIIVKTICKDYFFFQMVSFLIDLLLLFHLFKYYNPEKILLAFAFFFPFLLIAEVNLMRNVKAIYLFFLSLKFIDFFMCLQCYIFRFILF